MSKTLEKLTQKALTKGIKQWKTYFTSHIKN